MSHGEKAEFLKANNLGEGRDRQSGKELMNWDMAWERLKFPIELPNKYIKINGFKYQEGVSFLFDKVNISL